MLKKGSVVMLVRINQRGSVTIPKALRQGLDENAVLEAVRREDGVIELRPQTMVDASQAWFWTDRWQRMEREADDDYASGRFKTFDDVESFLADLDSAAEAADQHPAP
jgi:bifunctional DNA-binding transcriptional regulator/antitoxin component of YhaV-PrlF toxin-antitoxin module